MSSILLGLTLIAVAWLAIWSVKDHSRPSKTWWLFEIRHPELPDDRQLPYRPGVRARVRGRIKAVQRPWHRPGS